MKKDNTWRLLPLVAAMAIANGVYAAEGEADAEGEEAKDKGQTVVTLGSRMSPRSMTESPVPVDVIDVGEFQTNASIDMTSLISATVPSFNVNEQPISDAATLVRPANLRGLPPDNTLVLVNGKRRHRSSVITFLGGGLSDGSHGPDLGVIPTIGLKRVEVLRDGAAAQYGSDAIAGVMNFELKDNNSGGQFEARWGSYFEGDGDKVRFSGNVGLPLTQQGFFNVSFEVKDQ